MKSIFILATLSLSILCTYALPLSSQGYDIAIDSSLNYRPLLKTRDGDYLEKEGPFFIAIFNSFDQFRKYRSTCVKAWHDPITYREEFKIKYYTKADQSSFALIKHIDDWRHNAAFRVHDYWSEP